MNILTPEQIQRIYSVTDSLGLHRNWVVIPLAATATARETALPDGKILINAPGGAAFDGWIVELRARLADLNLKRTPRADRHDTPARKTPVNAPPGSGPRKFLSWKTRKSEARSEKSE